MQAEPFSETVESILAQFPGPVVLRQEEDKQYHFVTVGLLEHDPEKWEPVFGKDHAQTKS